MVRVTTGRGTGTRNVKKASAWAGSKYRKAQAKKNVGRTISTGRGTGTRKITATKTSGTKRKPSIRSGRGLVSRTAKSKSRATGMRAARASGKVKRSGRGYIAASSSSATKKSTSRPSMRSGRGTIRRTSSGTYKKSTAKRKSSTRSGRGYVRR